uniref:Uncharacterized protein n=1 Tax=Utricularia reniformis TaxID=192314 RepID=A0A1Y0B3M8_9LAMI|nr:hypothetical protein AEK19_MT1816 [Utricularia reniformis]ART31987.1 hypothetical protein AEK19_MT1816 [Utricularia reniformis]
MSFLSTWKAVPSMAWFKKLMLRSTDDEGRPLGMWRLTIHLTEFFSELGCFRFACAA